MKKIIVIVIIASLVGSKGNLFGQKIEVFNAMTIMELVKERIAKIETFTGWFVYQFENKTYSGSIMYKSPNKFLMDFKGKAQRIMSDGKYLWLIFDSQSVAVKEILDTSQNDPLKGWNIKRLLREYAPTEPPEGFKVKYKDQVCYKVVLVPRVSTTGFRKIELIISQDGYILKANAKNTLGKTVVLEISYDKASINKGISDEHFQFEPDENTQIYENLLTHE